ncbi:MAG: amidohydrolase family protein, partial [Halanaerobiales bacterium]|nr:amidohydrolase family protein [Halanaerobiales bacterium]
MRKIAIVGGNIITPFQVFKEGIIVVENNRISSVGEKKEIPLPTGAEIITANEKYVVPGFIDLHVHGGGGFDTMDGSYEALQKIAAFHARFGTTALLPTTVTDSSQRIIHSLKAIDESIQRGTGSGEILGAHLEGPYISRQYRGAHRETAIREPSLAELIKFTGNGNNIIR